MEKSNKKIGFSDSNWTKKKHLWFNRRNNEGNLTDQVFTECVPGAWKWRDLSPRIQGKKNSGLII